MNTFTSRVLVAIATVVAAAVRLHRLPEKSLALDEGTCMTLVRMPWAEFLRTLRDYEGNMSLYYLFLRAWTQVGDSELVLRLPSVLFGTATIPVLYVLGRRLFGERVGVLAAALLALNTLHIQLSQTARGYPLLILLVVLSTYCFVRAAEAPARRLFWVLYVAATVLAVYTHFFAALLPVAQWLALGPRWRTIGLRRTAAVALALAVLLTPAIAFVLTKDQGQLSWIDPLSAGWLVLTFVMLAGFNLLVVLLTAAGVVRGLRAFRRDDDDALALRLCALGFALPILIVLALYPVKPVFFFQYFAFCIPAGLLLTARVLSPARTLSRKAAVAVGAVVVLTLGLSVFAVGFTFQHYHDWAADWRAATEHIGSQRQEGDALIVYHSAGLDPHRYHRDRVPSSARGVTWPEVIFPAPHQLASAQLRPDDPGLAAAARRHPRLWLLLHLRKTADLPAEVLAPFRLVQEKTFGDTTTPVSITVALYERSPAHPTSPEGRSQPSQLFPQGPPH